MEAKIKAEMAGRAADDIEELYLDGTEGSTDIQGLDDKFTALSVLSLVNCGLTSLKGLPMLPRLLRLDIADNKLAGDLDIIAKNCPELIYLNISSNKFNTFEQLEPLKEMRISELDCFGSEVATLEKYREKIFNLVSSLLVLDGLDKNGEEVDDELSDESLGEHGGSDLDDEEDGLEDEEADDGPGLSYLLNDSQTLAEDDSADFDPEKEKRGKKRPATDAAGEAGDEPENKKEVAQNEDEAKADA
ncbi:hypothetical protein WR25_17634 [Diploscapter pachys]|uniref:U2A'/phosphoprotein 32 family A C-terminal domain-containing protein n=1 Tax=Diploscapter pachys TaxID=2018661 RepID=A0A2A2LC64_9BILA|nr:hypothetical protein WR25_17634 [Diploscapter pachys]